MMEKVKLLFQSHLTMYKKAGANSDLRVSEIYRSWQGTKIRPLEDYMRGQRPTKNGMRENTNIPFVDLILLR